MTQLNIFPQTSRSTISFPLKPLIFHLLWRHRSLCACTAFKISSNISRLSESGRWNLKSFRSASLSRSCAFFQRESMLVSHSVQDILKSWSELASPVDGSWRSFKDTRSKNNKPHEETGQCGEAHKSQPVQCLHEPGKMPQTWLSADS